MRVVPRLLKFRLIPVDGGYCAGDARPYYVSYRGTTIGVVEPCPLPGARTDSVVDGWSFSGEGRTGAGRTRAAAVADAFNVWVSGRQDADGVWVCDGCGKPEADHQFGRCSS